MTLVYDNENNQNIKTTPENGYLSVNVSHDIDETTKLKFDENEDEQKCKFL